MNIEMRFREDSVEIVTNDALFMQTYAASRSLELARARLSTSVAMFLPGFLLVCMNSVFSMEMTWKTILGTVLLMGLINVAINLYIRNALTTTFRDLSQHWFKGRQ
jgi:hypothetical protein